MKTTLVVASAVLLVSLLAPGLVPEAKAHCKDNKIKGSYGFSITGERIGGDSPGPRADVGTFTADGKGTLTDVSATQSKNGVIGSFTGGTGSYSVNADCTGTFTFNSPEGESRSGALVILNPDHEILLISNEDGKVLSGSAKPREQ